MQEDVTVEFDSSRFVAGANEGAAAADRLHAAMQQLQAGAVNVDLSHVMGALPGTAGASALEAMAKQGKVSLEGTTTAALDTARAVEGVGHAAGDAGHSIDAIGDHLGSGLGVMGETIGAVFSGAEPKEFANIAKSAFGEVGKIGSEGLGEVANASDKAGGSLEGMGAIGKTGIGMIVIGAAAAVAAVAAIGFAAVEATKKFGELAIEESEAHNQSVRALTAITGSGSKAVQVMEELEGTAAKSPFKAEELSAYYTQLTAVGEKSEEIQRVLAGAGDIAGLVGGDKGKAAGSALVDQLMQMQSIGSLAERQLKSVSMATGGMVQVEAVEQAIAKLHGITQDEAKKLLKEGKINADEGQKVILDALQNTVEKGGQLGDAAAAAVAASLPLAASKAHDAFGLLFSKVDDTPLTRLITSVTKSLGESGLGDSISKAGDALFGLLDPKADLGHGILTEIEGLEATARGSSST